MRVFIVEGHLDYEGFTIEGVCESIEDAEKIASQLREQKAAGYDHVEITGHGIIPSNRGES